MNVNGNKRASTESFEDYKIRREDNNLKMKNYLLGKFLTITRPFTSYLKKVRIHKRPHSYAQYMRNNGLKLNPGVGQFILVPGLSRTYAYKGVDGNTHLVRLGKPYPVQPLRKEK